MALMKLFHRVFSHMLVEVAIRSVRSSALTTGAVLLMSSVGAWQYLGNSLQAVDMRFAARAEPVAPPEQRVTLIAIDDAAYQRFFSGQSPLRQDRVAALLDTVATHARNARKIVVDLDVAPSLDGANAERLAPVLQAHAQRWVLASVAGATPADNANRAVWRQRLCQQGVGFGSPMVPTAFGYARMTHQYVGALSDVAAAAHPICAEPEPEPKEHPAPLSPQTLYGATVLPFSGDLQQLAQMLDAIDPQWVVLGGTWGKDDVFLTPFGQRYGMQVHAAALAGRLQGRFQVPYGVQMVVAWLFVTCLSVVLSTMTVQIRRFSRAPFHAMQGHQFFDTRILPMMLMVTVLFMLAMIFWLLGTLWGRSGVWIPSSTVGSVTLIAVMLIWNWGKADVAEYRNLKDARQKIILNPLKADWKSARLAWGAMRGQVKDPDWVSLSRPRLMFEGLTSLTSIALQNVLPLFSVMYALTKPL